MSISSIDDARRKRDEREELVSRSGSTFGGGGPTSGDMEPRVKALEDAMLGIKTSLATLEERSKNTATKEDIAKLDGEVKGLRGEMKGTLGFWQFLLVVGALLAVILRWPELFRLAGVGS